MNFLQKCKRTFCRLLTRFGLSRATIAFKHYRAFRSTVWCHVHAETIASRHMGFLRALPLVKCRVNAYWNPKVREARRTLVVFDPFVWSPKRHRVRSGETAWRARFKNGRCKKRNPTQETRIWNNFWLRVSFCHVRHEARTKRLRKVYKVFEKY